MRSDIDASLGDIKVLKWLFMAVVAVFGALATVIAIAADII